MSNIYNQELMKTRQYITAMLIALIFGIVTIQAQTTRRSPAQEKNERTPTSRTDIKKSTPQNVRSTQSARQVQTTRKTPERTIQPARQVQTPRTTQQRTTSVSNSNNPRSTYRNTNTNVYVDHNGAGNNRDNRYSNERYYGGHYYHNAYPTRKVNFHYHHDTYVHNYHVLYYPAHRNIYWNREMYRDYHRWYPEYQWRYNYGYSIQTISAFDAKYNLGEVAMVYGRVYSSWHNEETDDYLLFFGGDYPYQQFTVVLPGHIARRFNWRPERYFLGEHLTITGLITTFDGSPEIIVKNRSQIGIY